MLDKSRITLCMVLLAVFAFNPFSGLFHESEGDDLSSTPQTRSGRTLSGLEGQDFGISATSRWAMNWILHFIIFLLAMVKIFIYGEAHIDVKSKGRLWLN